MIYFILLILTAGGPLIFGFDQRVRFNQRWRDWFPYVGLTAAAFVTWDAWFTKIGVWGFNSAYVGTHRIFGLPFEEVAFFLVVPYACMFILSVTKYYDSQIILGAWSRAVTVGLTISLAVFAVLIRDLTYPAVASVVAAGVLAANLCLGRNLGSFYLAFLVSLVPFLLVNGVLTGTGLEAPVVWYDDTRNLGVRLGTIPIDDVIYCLAMLGAAEGGPWRLIDRVLTRAWRTATHSRVGDVPRGGV